MEIMEDVGTISGRTKDRKVIFKIEYTWSIYSISKSKIKNLARLEFISTETRNKKDCKIAKFIKSAGTNRVG